MARSGRRAGDGDTREEILAAARTLFAREGYQASIRGIATEAGVDPALVMHYFGSKERLYSASIQIPVDPATFLETIHSGPHDEVGIRLATMFFAVWDDPEFREPILAILRGAISGKDSGVTAFREFVTNTMVPGIASEVAGSPHAERNTELAVAQLVGVALMRYVMRLEPVASIPKEELIQAVGTRIQGYFD